MCSQVQRILIVSASIGGGHVAAGAALAEAFRLRGHRATHIDLLDHTPPPFRSLYRDAYFDLVRTAPDLIEWIGRRLDRRPGELKSRQERLRSRLTRVISYTLPRLIDRHDPDLLLHTHFLAPGVLAALRPERRPPQGVVITDFVAHTLWLQPTVQRYFVATGDVAAVLAARGVEAERIEVTGIPIDVRFDHLPSRRAARRELGLDEGRPEILVMAGGLDTDTAADLVGQLAALPRRAGVTVVCGRSPELQKTLTRAAQTSEGGRSEISVLGFSDRIPTLMAAADLLVAKPGGLTSSEALAAALPSALVSPYPLQEVGNAQYLLEVGAAVRIEPRTLLTHKVSGLLDDPARLRRMSDAARRAGRPRAALDVVDAVAREPLL